MQGESLEGFLETYNRGDKVNRQIKSITDFGILSAWRHLTVWCICRTSPGTFPGKAVRNYQKAQPLEAMVLSIDPERERIPWAWQLAKDPFSAWIAEHPKGTIIKGAVREVDAKGAIIDLATESTPAARFGTVARSRRGRRPVAESRR